MSEITCAHAGEGVDLSQSLVNTPPMYDPSPLRLAQMLSQIIQTDMFGLADAWFDRTIALCLKDVGGQVPVDMGGHVRRSFLGALAAGASPFAQAGQPCEWDPPCALDVFRREQLRGPKGDGLPKPYVLRVYPSGNDLHIVLRIFGMANDWSFVAAEALLAGLRNILPWSRVMPRRDGPPEIGARRFSDHRIIAEEPPEQVRLVFLSPMDATGQNPLHEPSSVITRMLRRVDGVSRWNAVGLHSEMGVALAAHAKGLDYDVSALRPSQYSSPNRHKQKRHDPVLNGTLTLSGDLAPLWPMLQIAERCHIGRHAVEGLGAFRLERIDS